MSEKHRYRTVKMGFLCGRIFALACAELTSADALEEAFRNPPDNARPYVGWDWMRSNFSKARITRDLEAMKACGVGCATIFNITSVVQESQRPTENNPWPKQLYRSPACGDAVRHAAAEADRLKSCPAAVLLPTMFALSSVRPVALKSTLAHRGQPTTVCWS